MFVRVQAQLNSSPQDELNASWWSTFSLVGVGGEAPFPYLSELYGRHTET